MNNKKPFQNISKKISKIIDELKELFLKTWSAEDMEENDGKFRWPFDEHGNLLDNVNMTRRID